MKEKLSLLRSRLTGWWRLLSVETTHLIRAINKLEVEVDKMEREDEARQRGNR
jgi:hypothetical protein